MPFDYTNRAWIRGKRTSLKISSFDSEKHEYMTESTLNVIALDDLKKEYLQKIGLEENLANSADAMTADKEYTYIIEFKNGDIEPRQVENKLKDSVMMLCDIWRRTTSDTRKDIIFVLVYNEEYKKKHQTEKLAIAMANNAGRPHPMWGLDKANTYVKKAVIYNKEEFNSKLLPKLKNV